MSKQSSLYENLHYLIEEGFFHDSKPKIDVLDNSTINISTSTGDIDHLLCSFTGKYTQTIPQAFDVFEFIPQKCFLLQIPNKGKNVQSALQSTQQRIESFLGCSVSNQEIEKIAIAMSIYGITNNKHTFENFNSFTSEGRYTHTRKEFLRGIIQTPKEHLPRAIKLFLSGLPFETILPLIEFPDEWIEKASQERVHIKMTDSINWDFIKGLPYG